MRGSTSNFLVNWFSEGNFIWNLSTYCLFIWENVKKGPRLGQITVKLCLSHYVIQIFTLLDGARHLSCCSVIDIGYRRHPFLFWTFYWAYFLWGQYAHISVLDLIEKIWKIQSKTTQMTHQPCPRLEFKFSSDWVIWVVLLCMKYQRELRLTIFKNFTTPLNQNTQLFRRSRHNIIGYGQNVSNSSVKQTFEIIISNIP